MNSKKQNEEKKKLNTRFEAIEEKNKEKNDDSARVDLKAARNLLKPEQLEEEFKKRRKWLGDQFVQLLRFQLENGVGQIVKDENSTDTFSMHGIGLVGKAIKIDSGLIMSEEVMQEDTAAIYGIFNGFTVTFGNEAEVDYNKKTLTIPESLKPDGAPKTFTLKTAYFNISTQGDQTNTGSQLETNRKAIDELFPNLFKIESGKVEDNSEYTGIAPNLKDKEVLRKVYTEGSTLTDADAEALGALLRKVDPNAAQHRNCVSGKDRTSIITGNELNKKITEGHRFWLPSFSFGPGSVTTELIEKNTGKTEIKANIFAQGRRGDTLIDITNTLVQSRLRGKGGSKT